MNNKNFKTAVIMLGAMIIILACGLPGASDVTETPATVTSVATETATEVGAPPTEIVAPSIQHQTIPVGLPEKGSGQAGDFDFQPYLKIKPPIRGDRFTYGRFEPPLQMQTPWMCISPSLIL